MRPVLSEPGESEAGLWSEFQASGSLAARQALFLRHAAFARNIARRHHRELSRGDIDLRDLQQLAYAGLLEALDRYDPGLGAPFRPFAAHRVNGSIRDGLMRASEVREQITWRHRARRERLASLAEGAGEDLGTAQAMARLADIAVGLALGFMLEGTGLFVDGEGKSGAPPSPSGTAYDSLAWKETVTLLRAAVAGLPDRERMILQEHYLNGMTFDSLARLLGVTKGRVSQMHRAALRLLRKRMGERGQFGLGR